MLKWARNSPLSDSRFPARAVTDVKNAHGLAFNAVIDPINVLLAAKQLAAKLGQGDITRLQYDAEVSYAFGDMVRGVLGLKENQDED